MQSDGVVWEPACRLSALHVSLLARYDIIQRYRQRIVA